MKMYRPQSIWVRRLMMGQILLCAVLVIWMAVATLAYDRKAFAEQVLTGMARDYYENYFYDKFAAGRDEEVVKAALAHYAEPGLRVVSLTQLLTYDNRKQGEYEHYFEGCKEATGVFFWPEEPYGREDYRLEVNLVCEDDEERD